MIQWIMLILRISKFWINSLRNRFWKIHFIFEFAWVTSVRVGIFFSKSPNEVSILRWSFWCAKLGVLIWFHTNSRNFNPRNFHFLVSFPFETIFPLSPSVTTLISEDVEFYCVLFNISEKLVGRCPPTLTPTQNFKNEFSLSNSHEIGSSLVSFKMIFEALKSELLRFKFHSLRSKLQTKTRNST